VVPILLFLIYQVFKHASSRFTALNPRSDICDPQSSQLGVYCCEDHHSQETYWEHKEQSIQCALCLSPVSGLFIICEICGHGGHAHHLSEWFAKYEECPTGCKCRCRSTLRYEEEVDFEDDANESYLINTSVHDVQLDTSNHGQLPSDFSTKKQSFYGKITTNPPRYFQEITLEQNNSSAYNYNRAVYNDEDQPRDVIIPSSLDSNY
jgi:hypothetical protein